MSGGVVYGSEAEASKKNTATAGAMIYLYLKGSATLGGATSGSRDTTIDLR
jgi:hypothetical protein